MLKIENKPNYKLRMIKAIMFLLLSSMYTFVNREVPNAMDMALPIDRATPFLPFTIIIYHLWYPCLWYLIYALRFSEDFDNYLNHLILAKMLCVFTFILFPTYVSIRTPIENPNFFEWIVNLTYKIDKPYCAFPSSHVALATIAIIFALRNPSKKINFITPFQLMVIISTLTTRQHVMLDIVGGICYAIVTYTLLNKEVICLPLKRETDLLKPYTKAI